MFAHDLPAEAWIDELDDQLLGSGELDELIRAGRVQGLTSNPSILEAAFARSIDGPARTQRYRCSSQEIYQEVAYGWIVAAADCFRGIYDNSQGHSGYVSIELPPSLAKNQADTVREGYELAKKLDRPNVMIKVPGTVQGLAATRDLLALGVPVNVTLLFAPARFDAVAAAYLEGMARLPDRPGSPRRPACVASFFVSRFDSAVDRMLKALATPQAAMLIGSTALSCADATWSRYQSFAREQRFRTDGPGLRLLWASTSVKDKSFAPLKYVQPLMRAGTVTTMSKDTLKTWMQQAGKGATPTAPPPLDITALRAHLAALRIDLETVIATLEEQGLQQFEDSFDRMIRALEPTSALA